MNLSCKVGTRRLGRSSTCIYLHLQCHMPGSRSGQGRVLLQHWLPRPVIMWSQKHEAEAYFLFIWYVVICVFYVYVRDSLVPQLCTSLVHHVRPLSVRPPCDCNLPARLPDGIGQTTDTTSRPSPHGREAMH